jgi:hypothetical protein
MIKWLIFFLLLIACDKPCVCQKVIDIQQQHATRAWITYQCTNGSVQTESYHWSNNLYCNGQLYHAGDYISGYGNKKFEKIQQ